MAGNPHDLRVGMRALDRGYIRALDLQKAIVEHTRRILQLGPAGPSFDFFLLSRGYLSAEQLAAVVSEDSPSAGDNSPQAASAPPAPHPLGRFGKYSLLRELGRGGMGEVVEAIDQLSGRRVAIKRPFFRRGRPITPNDEERFLREAEVVSGLPRHPHLVEIYDFGKIDGQCYIAMEVVDGLPMSEWRKTATLREELEVILQIAPAVEHAHSHGIIHRDLKPSNVMIRTTGQAVVTDFGLAKSQGPDAGVSLTPYGVIIGSPGYMSPEQARCLNNVDRRTDIYSLGVMLYETLTGRKPFEGRSAMEILLRMIQDPVRRPSEIMRAGLNPVLYQDIENVCLRALQKDPKDRTPSARALAEDLKRALGGAEEEPRSYQAVG
jgi:serine/threonine protein kinase